MSINMADTILHHAYFFICFFFFQAEDGIRDLTVTGVQTCALPILVSEVVGIADTMILGTAPDQLALLRTVCRHSFIVLQDLALQAAVFGTREQREGPARSLLRCLERRGATDAERRVALRMAVAAHPAPSRPHTARTL